MSEVSEKDEPSIVCILNDLIQRGHLPKINYTFTYEHWTLEFTCVAVVKNENTEIKYHAVAKSKREAKEVAAVKIFSNIGIDLDKYKNLKRHTWIPVFRAWYVLVGMCTTWNLKRPQIYMDTTKELYHVCMPELDLHVCNGEIEIATHNIIAELGEAISSRGGSFAMTLKRDVKWILADEENANLLHKARNVRHMYKNIWYNKKELRLNL